MSKLFSKGSLSNDILNELFDEIKASQQEKKAILDRISKDKCFLELLDVVDSYGEKVKRIKEQNKFESEEEEIIFNNVKEMRSYIISNNIIEPFTLMLHECLLNKNVKNNSELCKNKNFEKVFDTYSKEAEKEYTKLFNKFKINCLSDEEVYEAMVLFASCLYDFSLIQFLNNKLSSVVEKESRSKKETYDELGELLNSVTPEELVELLKQKKNK